MGLIFLIQKHSALKHSGSEKNAFDDEFDNNHLTSAFIHCEICREQEAAMYNHTLYTMGKNFPFTFESLWCSFII